MGKRMRRVIREGLERSKGKRELLELNYNLNFSKGKDLGSRKMAPWERVLAVQE